ncbi:MAG: putative Ig domain-containing protein [Verrucomicrobiia bacterium]
MKPTLFLSLTLAVSSAVGVAQAQPVYTVDPPVLINDYVSLGEFDTNGVVEGWGFNQGAVTLAANNGLLRVTTTGGDPWFFRTGIPGLAEDFLIVQVRARVLAGERGGWEMFWGSSAGGQGGFSGGRRIGYELGFDDSEFHILEYDFSAALDGSILTDFRIDPGQNAGNRIEIDYVRVGKVSPDTDGDGLPDTVETGTGVFVGPRDTGTKPDVADSDGDGASDAMEVMYGTDPNDAAQFPVPSIDRYSANPVAYIVGVTIEPNIPTTSSGSPTSFQVSPALPQGLQMSPSTGQITGTPTTAQAAQDYTVTANFAGGKTATALLNIQVRNPYIEFTVATRALKKDVPIAPFAPDIYGPAPVSFRVQPALPEGLELDPTTGEIFGAPVNSGPLATYNVTADYQDGPDSVAQLHLAVLEDPVATIDPEEPVLEWFSIGEFDDPAEANVFGISAGLAPLVAQDGLLTVTTIGGDPFFVRGGLPTDNGYRILELRMRVVSGGTGLRLYWSEDAPNRGMSEATAWSLPEINTDGEFHVYQVSFANSTLGPFTAMRLDPPDGEGTILDIDYIRLGSLTVSPRLAAVLQADGKLRISWPAGVTSALQSTASLPTGWAADPAPVTTEGSAKFISVDPGTGNRFYRLAP